MSNRFQLVPAAYLIMRRGDRVLLQLRQNTGYMDGYWAWTAGTLEAITTFGFGTMTPRA